MTTHVIDVIYYGQTLSKKNRHVPNGRGGITLDAGARQNENDIVAQIEPKLRKMGIRTWEPDTIAKDEWLVKKRKANVSVTFFDDSHRRRDLDNQLTTILDALKRTNAIPDDDKRFVNGVGAFDGGVDADNPRAEISITYMEP